jgi:hypothetical protein
METPALVAAFCDSVTVRETLAVLLEDACQLHFVHPHGGVPPELEADLALVATRAPAPLLQALAHRWPTLPIVAVDLAATAPPPGGSPLSTVPLEPHAIRTAVLRELPQHSGAALRALVHRVVHALQAELAYAFAALRSFAALHTAGAGPDSYTILGALAAEQCRAIMQSAEHLHDFLGRPRNAEVSPRFVEALCDALERPEPSTDAVLFAYTSAPSEAAQVPGPLHLTPVVAGCLRAYLQRRTAAPLIHIHTADSGITIRYEARPSTAAVTGSWPLLLASLALAPSAWQVTTAMQGDEEIVHVHPMV